MISLLILGVIASLTIPSLIQNTHKKEEVVKIKKGLSVINQAIAMDKALTGEDLMQYTTGQQLFEMFKKRLSVVWSNSDNYFGIVTLSDGISYFIDLAPLRNNNSFFNVFIITKSSVIDKTQSDIWSAVPIDLLDEEKQNKMLGGYMIRCKATGCTPYGSLAEIINASDPTKVE